MIGVIVPVLGRAHQIEPLLESLAAVTTTDYRVTFVCSAGDEALDICKATEADVIVTTWEPGRGDFAKKVNLGYRATEEEILFQAATDLRFFPNWDTEGLRVARVTGAGVIGTNDLGNALVRRGHHSTHSFFTRAYIEEYGGTTDGTGEVFSEVYDHQYVDNEFVQVAMSRQMWAFANRSIVEHLHPLWNKGEMDETYEKAFREADADSQLYLQRIRTFRHRRHR